MMFKKKLNIPVKREKALGIAEQRRRYDLPLGTSPGNSFLMILVGLMTFLAMLMLLSLFMLKNMTENWSAGLENQVTVEVPAETSGGVLLSEEQMNNNLSRLSNMLVNFPAVKEIHVLTDTEIMEMVGPWLGGNALPDDVPLPGLISVTLKPDTGKDVKTLQNRVGSIIENARLDTHETWLNDLLSFTDTLRFAALILTLFVGFTTITAIASAIQSRMAEYHAEVELLHLMGASDRYIAGQLQRHSFILAVKGGLLGLAFGIVSLLIIKLLSSDTASVLLPDFTLTGTHYTVLALLPLIAGTIALLTARQTVMRVLIKMP